MTAVRSNPLTFTPAHRKACASVIAAILKNRSIHANIIRHHLSFYRGRRVGQFLYTVQKGQGMGMGELLDRWGLILVADHSAAGGVADGTAFYGDHRARIGGRFRLDVLLGFAMGRRGVVVRAGGALPGDVFGELGIARVYVGLWSVGAIHLL